MPHTEDLRVSQEKAAQFIQSQMDSEKRLKKASSDLADYFKLPMALILLNDQASAKKVLVFIQSNFLQSDGDLKTTADLKSKNEAYQIYWNYMSVWLLRAAQQVGLEKAFQSTFDYVGASLCESTSGFYTNRLQSKEQDVLTTAHHGLLALESGHLENAKQAAKFLCKVFDHQPAPHQGFYLRVDSDGAPIQQDSSFYYINASKPDQLYFMLGLPIVFLAKLYEAMEEKKYLMYATHYLDFALSCKGIYASRFSHKIAWAASLLYKITGNETYLQATQKIVDFFILKQNPDGSWWEGLDQIDQTCEILCWWSLIQKNLAEAKLQHQPQSQLTV